MGKDKEKFRIGPLAAGNEQVKEIAAKGNEKKDGNLVVAALQWLCPRFDR